MAVSPVSRGALLREVGSLKPRHHVCAFYRSPAEQSRLASVFLADGLRRGHRSVLVAGQAELEAVASALRDRGLDVRSASARGALTLKRTSELYVGREGFSPSGAIEMLTDLHQQTRRDGFPGLRVAGDMGWALDGVPGAERLIEYEAMTGRFTRDTHTLGLCLYDVRRFSASLVHGILRTHRHIVYGDRLRSSPFFGSHVRSVEWMLGQCRARTGRKREGSSRRAIRE